MPAKKAAAAAKKTPTGNKSSDAALGRFEERFAKKFGDDTLTRSTEIVPYIVIPTGSLTLDLRTGVGGWVRGRLNELWGVDGLGKSTMCLLAVAEAQRAFPDEMCAWIDMEHSFDPKWAIEHGVNLDRLYRFTPKDSEDVADALAQFCREGLFSLVIVDSVGGMIPRAEKEKLSEEEVVGKQAKIVTRMVKLNAVEAAQTNTCVILINQVRANIGAYGKDKTTSGGWALKYSTTMKMEIKRTGTPVYKVGTNNDAIGVGHEVSIRLERNRVGPSQRQALFSIFFVPTEKYGPIGVDKVDEAARLGVSLGIIEQAGAWYTTPDGERVNGLDRVVTHYRNHPELVTDMRLRIIATASGSVVADEFVEP